MNSRGTILFLAVSALVLGALGSTGAADEPEAPPDPAQMEREVAKEIMCPCPNCSSKLLSATFCGNAEKAKSEIRAMAAGGMTKEQIIADFVNRYGEEILAKPKERGFNLVGYWLPMATLVLGLVAVGLFLRRAVRRGREPEPAPARPVDPEEKPREPLDEYEERLRRELRSLGA
jgi:cytochrome c-type biogenesis protein CcmH